MGPMGILRGLCKAVGYVGWGGDDFACIKQNMMEIKTVFLRDVMPYDT